MSQIVRTNQGRHGAPESLDLTVVVLTFNEARHIERCIDSISALASQIVVVDSYSDDQTVVLASSRGVRVVQHRFVSQAQQLNWALSNIDMSGQWVLRLDADEFLSEALACEIAERLPEMSIGVAGIVLHRRVCFLRKPIRFGGFGRSRVLRLWRRGTARCEARWMDEHMVLSRGGSTEFRSLLIDDNLNGIGWWTDKHNRYATREAIELLDLRHHFLDRAADAVVPSGRAGVKRWVKERIYSRLPLGIRPMLYFAYRMFVLLGLLDGPRGWAFHFLQGFWYRLLVDIKVWEVERRMQGDGVAVVEAINLELGLDPLATGEQE